MAVTILPAAPVIATATTTGLLSTTDYKRFTGRQYDAQADFGFVGDLQSVFDGSCSTGAPTKITTAGAIVFTSAMVGKRITLAGAGTSGAMYVGTITALDSATQVTVSPSISTTVTSRGLQVGTDNTAAIALMTTAINTTSLFGCQVYFGASETNAYGFPTPVVLTTQCQFTGIGSGYSTETGDYTRVGGTRLAWWGTTSDGGTNFGAFISFTPAGGQSLKRVGLRQIWLDCRNGDQAQALIGLKLSSCQGFVLDELFVMDALAMGIWLDAGTVPSESRDSTRFRISSLNIRQIDNPSGISTTPTTTSSAVALTSSQTLTIAAATIGTTAAGSGYAWVMTSIGKPTLIHYSGGGGTTSLTGCIAAAEDHFNVPTTVSGCNIVNALPGNAACLYLNGSTTAKTSYGLIEMAQLSHGTTWGPAGIEIGSAENITFLHVVLTGGVVTNDGAINRIRKPGVRLNGSNTNAILAATNNTFIDGDPGAGGVSVMGLLNTASRMSTMAQPNYWPLYSLANGSPIPTVEGSAQFVWAINGGFTPTNYGTVPVANIAATGTAEVAMLVVPIPPQGIQAGTTFRMKFTGQTTIATGTGSNVFRIRLGTAGTTADAVIATLTTTVGSAQASAFCGEIVWVIRSIATPTAVTSFTQMELQNTRSTGAAGGFIAVASNIISAAAATFNATTPQQFITFTVQPGASKNIAITTAVCMVEHPANPN